MFADVTAIPLETVLSEAGSNVTLTCPGVTEHSLVLMLEWRSHIKLVEYMSDSTTVWEHRHRITLLPDTFGLHFHPVTAEDSAEYSCLVNNRPKPEAIVRLIVQGKADLLISCNFFLIIIFCTSDGGSNFCKVEQFLT